MILVTGATGNAGGGVINGLLELGAEARGLVKARLGVEAARRGRGRDRRPQRS